MIVHHKPVLLDYILKELVLPEDKNIVDFTLGEGGHTEAFLKKGYKVWSFEQDEGILQKAKNRLSPVSDSWNYFKSNFLHADDFLGTIEGGLDFCLFDLGISMYHYKESGRGFTFSGEEPLDMRLDPDNQELSAGDIVNQYPENDIADILYNLGGERKSRSIAKTIGRIREDKPISTVKELANITCRFYPPQSPIHPATRTFLQSQVFPIDWPPG